MQTVQLGFQCNNACVFCAQGTLRASSSTPGRAALLGLIEQAAAGAEVAFAGGEPTLDPDFPELVEHARRRGARSVLVQTNARRLASSGFADSLRDAGVTALDVSLQGDAEACHDYHTSVPGSFRQTVAGLRRARAARIPFVVSTVITRSNYRHLSEIVRVAHTLGARAVRLSSAVPVGEASRRTVVPDVELVRPYLARAVAEARAVGLPVFTSEPLPASAASWFAGLGVVETDSPSASAGSASADNASADNASADNASADNAVAPVDLVPIVRARTVKGISWPAEPQSPGV